MPHAPKQKTVISTSIDVIHFWILVQ
jgi:hypothetical protein